MIIFVSLGTTSTFDSSASQARDFDPTGWELALVTTPGSNLSATTERQLVGLFLCLLLSVSMKLYLIYTC